MEMAGEISFYRVRNPGRQRGFRCVVEQGAGYA
jgi:hypothetical protein